MYAQTMLTVQPSCFVPKPMVFHPKNKLPMCKKNIFVILTVLVCISTIMTQLIALKIKHVQKKFTLKTVKRAILLYAQLHSFLTLKKVCSYLTVSLKAHAQNVKLKINTVMPAKYVVQPIMLQNY